MCAWLGVFLVVPVSKDRLRWRLSLWVVGTAWAIYLLWSMSMPLPVRYMPQFAPLLIVTVSLSMAHLLRRLSLDVSWKFIPLVGAVLSLFYLYNGGYKSVSILRRYNKEQSSHLEVIDLVENYRRGDPVLDCSEKGMNMFILPETYVQQPFHQLQDSAPCEKWINTTGARWLLVNSKQNPDLVQAMKEEGEWTIAIHHSDKDFSLWRRIPVDDHE